MDVAVTSEARPISFQKQEQKDLVLQLNLRDSDSRRFTFHGGLRKKTSECIGRVDDPAGAPSES